MYLVLNDFGTSKNSEEAMPQPRVPLLYKD